MKFKYIIYTIVLTALLGLVAFSVTTMQLQYNSMIDEKKSSIAVVLRMSASIVQHMQEEEQAGRLSHEEAQQKALTSLKSMKSGSDYVFVRSRDNRMLVHPDPNRIGKIDRGNKEEDGRYTTDHYQDILAKSDSGFATAKLKNPATGLMGKKLNGILLFKPWGWVLGTGFFVDDIDRAFWSTASQFLYLAIGVGLLSAILLALGAYYALRVEKIYNETEDIMRTTQDGFFLLDHDLNMGSQTSKVLSTILGFDVFPGANFLSLLKPSVSPKIYETAREYIDLLLRHDVKEKLVSSLNPLESIEVTNMQADGSMESKFIQIKFNRVMRGNKVTQLLATARDITRQVKLENELRESEKWVQDQISLMVYILQVDPDSLMEFLKTATEKLDLLNNELRLANSRDGINLFQVKSILRNIHLLKGDSSSLRLDSITQNLHNLETLMQDLQNSSNLKGEELLPVTVKIKELYTNLNSIGDLITKIGNLRASSSEEILIVKSTEQEHQCVLQWRAFARNIANKYSKKIVLSYQGIDLDKAPQSLRNTINSIVNQFIRNSLIHGVEMPEQRRKSGKPAHGHLSIYLDAIDNGTLDLSFRDDGLGIDTDKIRETLVKTGKYSSERAAALTQRELASMLFEAGVSTKETINEDAGRGMGLDAVRKITANMGGRIRLKSKQGESCQFRVRLPINQEIEEFQSA